MKRRDFISVVLGGTTAAWPIALRAEQKDKLPEIGFLGQLTPSAMSKWTAAFVQRLHELGWIEGRNKLANDGRDTRALQHYLGHKNIMHTVRYTELSPDRFKKFWED
jgi:hypothetical protein